jgi:hypothetical protein
VEAIGRGFKICAEFQTAVNLRCQRGLVVHGRSEPRHEGAGVGADLRAEERGGGDSGAAKAEKTEAEAGAW